MCVCVNYHPWIGTVDGFVKFPTVIIPNLKSPKTLK